MEYFHVSVEILKIVIWPALIFWIIFYFKKNIAFFIDRIYQLKFPGGELNAEQKKEKQLEATELTFNEKNAEQSVPSNLVALIVENLRKEYDKNNQTTINQLINELATRDVMIDFERIYNLIFGSQITLLDFLITTLPYGAPKSSIDTFWNILKNGIYTYATWTLDGYLHFLLQARLICITEIGNYIITEKGMAFLTYIGNMKYIKNKGL